LRRPFPKGKTANGANIAATMLLLSSEILSAAILFRYGSDALSKRLPDHAKKHIFMSSGLCDPIVSLDEAGRLLVYLKLQALKFHSVGNRVIMS